jgi:hypothetical protein
MTEVPLGPGFTVEGTNIQAGNIKREICELLCVNARGHSVHTRRKHSMSYLAVRSPAVRAKTRWDPEVRYLMAKEEVRLTSQKVWDFNKRLQQYCLTEPMRHYDRKGGGRRTRKCYRDYWKDRML